MYDDYEGYGNGRNVGRLIGIVAIVAVVIGVGFTLTRRPQTPLVSAQAPPVATELGTAPTIAPLEITPSTTTTTTTVVGSDASASAAPAAAPVPTTSPAAEPADIADPSAPTTTTSAGTTASTAPAAPDLGYPASPDGAPLPVIVTYDTGTVTLTGAVPSEAAHERLVALATANSQDADAEVSDNLIVNQAVPASVGVRVIEMQSARFTEGRARLTPEHTGQLDRVVAVMQALPHLSVLVIGHADQRGDDLHNLTLSEERAGAVVDYLVYLGLEPTRISMRGAGETDLLTLDNDSSALALNRRTEFVFYGVLV